MRSVVLDTETTGLNAGLGDRIIELGCIEVLSRRVTGNHFHRYINPERESEQGALKVHGIDQEFLQDKPKFREIAPNRWHEVNGPNIFVVVKDGEQVVTFGSFFIDAEQKLKK